MALRDEKLVIETIMRLVREHVPCTITITRAEDDVMEADVVIDPTEDIVSVAKAVEEAGLGIHFDGDKMRLFQPGDELPVEHGRSQE